MRTSVFITGVLAASMIFALSQANTCMAQEPGSVYEGALYELVRSDPNVPLLSRFGVKEMAQQYLDDFALVKQGLQWNLGRTYVFQRNRDKAKVSVVVSLHSSVRDVEEVAIDHLNDISAFLSKEPLMGESIGDNAWGSASSTSSIVTHIVFIRRNALFILSSISMDMKAIAKAIDDDIIRGASYITTNSSISPPIIRTISLSQSDLKEGEVAKVTIDAIDPEGEPLECQCPLVRRHGDAENVFTFIATPDYVPAPFFGSHTIQAVVINKSNVVSRVFETVVRVF